MQSKQHNPWRRWTPVPKDQLAKIVIERQEDPILIESSLKNNRVRLACQGLGGMHNVVALDDQPLHDAAGKFSLAR